MQASFIEPWGELVESTMPPLARAFPNITANVLKLREAFKTGNIDLKQCIGSLIEGKEEDIIRMADYLGGKPAVLKFILGQMLKPFVEKGLKVCALSLKISPGMKVIVPYAGLSRKSVILRVKPVRDG